MADQHCGDGHPHATITAALAACAAGTDTVHVHSKAAGYAEGNLVRYWAGLTVIKASDVADDYIEIDANGYNYGCNP